MKTQKASYAGWGLRTIRLTLERLCGPNELHDIHDGLIGAIADCIPSVMVEVALGVGNTVF
jgi:hypothetical protein